MGKPMRLRKNQAAAAAVAAVAVAAPSRQPPTPLKKINKNKKQEKKKPEDKINKKPEDKKPTAIASKPPAAAEPAAAKTVKSNGKEVAEVEKKGKDPAEKSSGFIFFCSRETKSECYKYRVFGFPRGSRSVVERIKPGARLFLYDFDVKLMYGIYRATSQGGMDLVPEAFRGKFPAQVKFKIEKDCYPLAETKFKKAIEENYESRIRFKPDLNSRQVRSLLALFEPLPAAHEEGRRHGDWNPPPPVRMPPLEDPYRQRQLAHVRLHGQPLDPLPAAHEGRRHGDRNPPPPVHMPPPEDPYRQRQLAHVRLHGQPLEPYGPPHHRHLQPALEPRHAPPPSVLPYDPYYRPSSIDPYYPESQGQPERLVYHRVVPDTREPLPSATVERPLSVAERTDGHYYYPSDRAALQGQYGYQAAAYEDSSRGYATVESLQREGSSRAFVQQHSVVGPGPVSSRYSFAGPPVYR